MAVWGIGAYYNDSKVKDKAQDFLRNNFAYIGWKEPEAPAIYQMLRSIKVGDMIYIKSFSPKTKTLHIKALGIVIDNKLQYSEDLGTGVAVKWKDEFTEVIEISILLQKCIATTYIIILFMKNTTRELFKNLQKKL